MGGAVNAAQWGDSSELWTKINNKKAGELLGECDIFVYQVKGLGNN